MEVLGGAGGWFPFPRPHSSFVGLFGVGSVWIFWFLVRHSHLVDFSNFATQNKWINLVNFIPPACHICCQIILIRPPSHQYLLDLWFSPTPPLPSRLPAAQKPHPILIPHLAIAKGFCLPKFFTAISLPGLDALSPHFFCFFHTYVLVEAENVRWMDGAQWGAAIFQLMTKQRGG